MTFRLMKPRPRRLGWKLAALFLPVLLIALLSGYFFFLYTEVTHRFASRKWSIPSRVFSATVPLYPGQQVGLQQMRQMLEERRYQEVAREPLRAGEYAAGRGSLAVQLREFQFPGRTLRSHRIQVDFQEGRLLRIRGPEGDMAYLELEPLEIARLFGPEREGRLLISIRQAPRYLIDAVVAIEDHRFYEHRGIDWRGIFRALYTDLLARRVVQGGSTITQQLVKNYFLEPERNLKRKVLEASMALIIEAIYSKDEILEMYMNEIYMGQRGGASLNGMGEAARYYFGRNVEDLTLSEAATLAGMVRAPGFYSPITRPEASRERRDTVLRRMAELGKVSAEASEKARSEPLRLPGTFLPANVAPYFVDYVRRQLQALYAREVLESEGLAIYTTLHPEMALAAEDAVREGLEDLERLFEGARAANAASPLQAALVAVQPRTGAVLALVGGRDYGESIFNRALDALRQPGSAIKPFVYLSALDRFTPASWIPDEAAVYEAGGSRWTPKNYDQRYRGRVMLREAFEESLNAATVHLAMAVGLDSVLGTLRSFGIQSPLQPLPSLALGAMEVTPIELAGAYAALDNDGQKPYLLGLREVVNEEGAVQERRSVDFLTVTTPAKAYLATDLMQSAVEKGTGRIVRRLGVDLPCAGKTGTTSDYRDSWFVGYTTDLLVLVWVGYDDNRSTGMSGAQGAARIWARFVNRVRPWIAPQPFRIPPGVAQRIICSESGQLATMGCPSKRLECFLEELVPRDECTLHRRQ